MPAPKTSVTLDPRILAEIDRRVEYDTEGSRSATISRLLERYFSLLRRARGDLRHMFSDGEIMLIVDVLNGVAFFDTFGIYLIVHEVADGIEMDRLDQKWQVDGPALVAKLKGLNDAQTLAIVEGVTMWWNRVSKGEQPGHTAEEVFRDPPRETDL